MTSWEINTKGSILGPTLWNNFYGQILEIKTKHGVELVAYVDDLAVVVRAKTKQDLEDKAGHATQLVKWKLEEMCLKMAEAKTE